MDRPGLGTAHVIRANSRHLPLADDSVDLIVTSPPYFALRSYQDGGEHYAGQIGDEPTPAEFVDSLIDVTRECMRVLKPSGSLWVNLGDKYSANWTSVRGNGGAGLKEEGRGRERHTIGADGQNMRPKSLIGIPWRYALRCIDDLGLILRAEVIWSKCLSGGTSVYARVNEREKVMLVKDLARCVPGSVELWTGEKWSPMLRCDPTPPTEGRSASSRAARSARYRGKPVPRLVADLEIEFRNGERVGCTPNHKWPTQRGIVRADELTIGDVVPTVRLANGTASPAGLDDEMTGWLVGLYIAEGSRSEDMVQIASHVREQERFDRLRVVAEAFDGRFAVHPTKGNAATANLSGKMIRAILDTYVGGRVAGDKRLAPACWRRSDVFLRAVLDGYLSGDGHYDRKADRWVLGFTANDGLAVDLRAIAARLGYSLRLRRTVHKFDGRDFPGWGGTLYHDPARRKRPDSEIVAIRQSRARQFWNIEIADEPHEFALASGILTENSNGLPESVTDRVRRSHEQWFHFTLQPRYFAGVDEIRESHEWKASPGYRGHVAKRVTGDQPVHHFAGDAGAAGTANPLGKLPGSVWVVPTEPLVIPERVAHGLCCGGRKRPGCDKGLDHFAAFPSAWPKRIIEGWAPLTGVCTACGEGRRPVSSGESVEDRPGRVPVDAMLGGHGADGRAGNRRAAARGIIGYACACTPRTSHRGKQGDWQEGREVMLGHLSDDFHAPGNAVPRRPGGFGTKVPPSAGEWEYHFDRWDPPPTTPAVVLDVFGGTGTTAMVAKALGCTGITVDMSADYCHLARWRTNDRDQLAKVLGIAKAPAGGPVDEPDLFALLAGEEEAG